MKEGDGERGDKIKERVGERESEERDRERERKKKQIKSKGKETNRLETS